MVDWNSPSDAVDVSAELGVVVSRDSVLSVSPGTCSICADIGVKQRLHFCYTGRVCLALMSLVLDAEPPTVAVSNSSVVVVCTIKSGTSLGVSGCSEIQVKSPTALAFTSSPPCTSSAGFIFERDLTKHAVLWIGTESGLYQWDEDTGLAAVERVREELAMRCIRARSSFSLSSLDQAEDRGSSRPRR